MVKSHLDFYRRTIALAKQYRPGITMQTHSTPLDDDWCAFLKGQHTMIAPVISFYRKDIEDAT